MTAEKQVTTEICVIGGGPAGAAIARRLAVLGHEVCLVERSKFPRPHIGESLASSILPLLELLEVREQIESAGFIRPRCAVVSWGGKEETVFSPIPGFLVERSKFDSLLLKAAATVGVKILQPAKAGQPQHGAAGDWLIPVCCEGGKNFCIKAKFLVEAAGRNGATAAKRSRISAPTIAVYGYWADTGINPAKTFVEAGEEEWFWGGSLQNGLFNATIFAEPKRYAANGERSVAAFYRALLSTSRLLRKCRDGKLVGQVKMCDASGYFNADCVGADFIKIGEASFGIDPLSSQGVQAAIQSAVQGAIVVHTLLSSAGDARAASEFYRGRQTEMIINYSNIAADFYAEQQLVNPNSFWRKRSQKPDSDTQPTIQNRSLNEFPRECRFSVSESLALTETPVIERNIIRYKTAVVHPSLKKPIAFLNNYEIGKLLAVFDDEPTDSEIIKQWSRFLPNSRSRQILQWMWSHNLIVSK